MRTADPIRVEVVRCAKRYGQTQALHPCELTLEPGEIMALLGPSGCGKTTLLRLVAGLCAPDPGGTVRYGGEDVTSLAVESRGVGMVFQHYALFPHMTVASNIAYGLKLRRTPAAKLTRRVGELVDLMHLNGLEARRPAELSGGQKQRVALARALAIQPRVLLLDEPLTALDAKLKESLRDELATLLRRLGITTLHVTHDQQEAMVIADRLAVMHQGRIVQTGTAEMLYEQPAHPFVAQFLGRVNRLERSAEDLQQGVIRLGGAPFPCPPHLTGQQAVLLRPEDVQVAAPLPEQLDEPQAVVVQRAYLGERIQLRLSTPEGHELLCYAHKPCPFHPGATVAVRFHQQRLLAAIAS